MHRSATSIVLITAATGALAAPTAPARAQTLWDGRRRVGGRHCLCFDWHSAAVLAKALKGHTARSTGSEIEHVDRSARGVLLTTALNNGPLTGNSINRDGRPAMPVFSGNVDEQRVLVVLHANSVQWVALLLETADDATACDASHK